MKSTLLGCLFLSVSMAAYAAPSKMPGVVFQVSSSSEKTWNLTLNNVLNYQRAMGKKAGRIEIVAYGPGIKMLEFDSIVGNRINTVESKGIKVLACENTMRGQHLTKQDMLPSIGYVPAGVAEIVKREREGWSYVKP